MDDFGDRMKRYEAVTRIKGMINTPMILRLDGKAFHTLTRGAKKPFDHNIINAMMDAAGSTMKQLQGCKLAFVQSDEVTFLLSDLDSNETQPWFDYNIQKMTSVSAAYMSVFFQKQYESDKCAVFDSRAFNVPLSEVANCFLWRAKDWQRNSLQMLAQSVFSQNRLNVKKTDDLHEMLAQTGVSWERDLCAKEKYGTFIYHSPDGKGLVYDHDIRPRYDDVARLVHHLTSRTPYVSIYEY